MNLHRKFIAAEQKYQHLLKGSVFLKIFLGGMKGFCLPNRIEGERVKIKICSYNMEVFL